MNLIKLLSSITVGVTAALVMQGTTKPVTIILIILIALLSYLDGLNAFTPVKIGKIKPYLIISLILTAISYFVAIEVFTGFLIADLLIIVALYEHK